MCENYTSGVGLPSGGSHKSCVSASKKASVSSGAIAKTSPISENKKIIIHFLFLKINN